MGIPKSRAEAESAVEQCVSDILKRKGGEVGSSPDDYVLAFYPLAGFVFAELAEQYLRGTRRQVPRLEVFTELATRAVDSIVSPDPIEKATGDTPHDEWWRFAPPGIKKLPLGERRRIRNLLCTFLTNEEVPYWGHRSKWQSQAGAVHVGPEPVASSSDTHNLSEDERPLVAEEVVRRREFEREEHITTLAPMGEPQFSAEHREQLRELRKIGELNAINLSLEQLTFGPWVLGCDIGDHDTADRLKGRFLAAARKAAFAAGAPPRANLLDWWISKLARENRPYLQNLIQRSIEFCEELEAASLEVGWKLRKSNSPPGLRRDQYPTDFILPYWLYDVPHDTLPDPKEEFDFWEDHVWSGFWKLLKELGNTHAVDEDDTVRDLRKRQPGEARGAFRNRVANRVSTGYSTIKPTFECLGFDLAVLMANYVIDRKLTGSVAMRAFDTESAQLIEKMTACWKDCSRRLGLSWRKQLKEGKEAADFKGPFYRVAADLKLLVTARGALAPLNSPAANTQQEAVESLNINPATTPTQSTVTPIDCAKPIEITNAEQLILKDGGRSLEMEVAQDPGLSLAQGSTGEDGGARNRSFRKTGEIWVLKFDGRTIHVNHRIGLAHISHLLRSPGISVSCRELQAAGSGDFSANVILGEEEKRELHTFESGLYEVLDPKARKQYRERLESIEIKCGDSRFLSPQIGGDSRQISRSAQLSTAQPSHGGHLYVAQSELGTRHNDGQGVRQTQSPIAV